ncbi:MAG: hypothetical protein ACRDPB_03470 [Nocardioidaceae bacterium]
MEVDRRFVVVMVVLGFARSAAIGGTVVGFLALAGVIGGRAALAYLAGVLLVSAGLAIGSYRLARRARHG